MHKNVQSQTENQLNWSEAKPLVLLQCCLCSGTGPPARTDLTFCRAATCSAPRSVLMLWCQPSGGPRNHTIGIQTSKV
uniref:Omega-3 fatty acid desaturase n=1 Tax=Arundo donax TaxID=35708 RepID=A0A0A9F9E5_ARUDO